MARDENMIAALKRERAAYLAAGKTDRVRQVEESLAHYGYTPPASEPDGPQAPQGQQPQGDGPQGRDTAPRQTADQSKTPAKKTTAAKKTAAPATPPEK